VRTAPVAVGTATRHSAHSLPRRAIRLIAVALATLLFSYAAVCAYVANEVTRVKDNPVDRDPGEIARPHEEIELRTADGLRLRGWFFPAGRERAAVLVHGKDGNRGDSEWMLKVARLLHGSGYSLLTFDMRGHGESEGERFSLGQYERYDVAAAVAHLVGRGFAPGRIALVAESMGTGAVLQSLALHLDVGPLVMDSVWADTPVLIEDYAPHETGLPSWFTPGIVAAARLLLSLDAEAVFPERVVSRDPDRALLIIHCDGDEVMQVKHAYRLRAASANPASELWVAADCGHVGALARYPAEYERRVLAFLERTLR
jgi:pimeloyl-ACP methyl ester carboxylesterase